MTVAIGPGTRLLCVTAADGCEVGLTYTCLVLFPHTEFTWCATHTDDCGNDGVQLCEIPRVAGGYGSVWVHCLGCFRPLGGELPAALTACLNVKPVKVLEDA